MPGAVAAALPAKRTANLRQSPILCKINRASFKNCHRVSMFSPHRRSPLSYHVEFSGRRVDRDQDSVGGETRDGARVGAGSKDRDTISQDERRPPASVRLLSANAGPATSFAAGPATSIHG
jgi:hypothetical protein